MVAPAGTGAPVMILTAVPGEIARIEAWPAPISPTTGSVTGRPRSRRRRPRRPRRSRPSRSCRSTAARSGRRRPRPARGRGPPSAAAGRPAAARPWRGCARGSPSTGSEVSHARPGASLVEDGAALDPLGRRGVERDVADDLHAAAEGPVALDRQRVGLAQRRRTLGEALVEVADQLVEVAVERRRRARRRSPGRARSPRRGRRRRSAAPAGRWSSSPARTGRGRPRSCARPRRPRSPRPSRVSIWITFGRARVGRVDVLDVADQRQARGCRRARRAPRFIACEVEPQVVGRAEAVAVEVGQRLLVGVEGLRGLAQHDPAVGLAAGEVAALAVRGRTPHGLDRERRTARGEPAGDARRRAPRRGCRSWRRRRSGSRRRSAGRAGRCRAARCRCRRGPGGHHSRSGSLG